MDKFALISKITTVYSTEVSKSKGAQLIETLLIVR